MGVWGVGPFDHDGAGDFIAGLYSVIRKVVEAPGSRPELKFRKGITHAQKLVAMARWRRKNEIARDFYLDARTNVAVIQVAHGSDILGGPDLILGLQALMRMRQDAEWLASYRQPRMIARALNGEIEQLVERMNRCKGCRRQHGKTSLRELTGLALLAMSAPIPKSEHPRPGPKTRAKRRRRRRP